MAETTSAEHYRIQDGSKFRAERYWALAMGDGTFSPAKKGGLEVGKTKKGKGTKLMLLTEAHGIPISVLTTSAQVAEVHTIETLVDLRVTTRRPKRLIYDKAADADWIRDSLS